jgi:hypothetical protein
MAAAILFAMSGRSVFRDEYYEVVLDEARHLVVARRSAKQYPDVETMDRAMTALADSFEHLPLVGLGLLVDSREAVGRNDDGFETTLAKHRHRLYGRFKKRAVLMKTPVGAMQARRLERSSDYAFEVFQDEAAAVAFLAG